MYDVIIIGGGPGGLTAAIYATRSNLKTLIIEKSAPGGKVALTSTIENWTGDIKIKGHELASKMFKHSTAFGAEYKYGNVIKLLSHSKSEKEVILEDGTCIKSKSIIISTGMVEKKPNIIGIKKFENRGLSYCAICDGFLYKNQSVAIIGGGNSAIDESIYLSSIASDVTVFVRKPEELIADKKTVKEAKEIKNIKIVWGEIEEVMGEEKIEFIKANINGKKIRKKISAIFPYIGYIPATDFLQGLKIANKNGFIKTNELMETNIPNIFAVGDIRDKKIRQIITAVNDGAIAGKMASKII